MTLEEEIQAKKLIAPRITPHDIENAIISEHYFTAADGLKGAVVFDTYVGDRESATLSLLTFCVLVLKNGFMVTGESACASPEIFNAEIGRKVARTNATEKIWPLEGYLLKEKLSNG